MLRENASLLGVIDPKISKTCLIRPRAPRPRGPRDQHVRDPAGTWYLGGGGRHGRLHLHRQQPGRQHLHQHHALSAGGAEVRHGALIILII